MSKTHRIATTLALTAALAVPGMALAEHHGHNGDHRGDWHRDRVRHGDWYRGDHWGHHDHWRHHDREVVVVRRPGVVYQSGPAVVGVPAVPLLPGFTIVAPIHF